MAVEKDVTTFDTAFSNDSIVFCEAHKYSGILECDQNGTATVVCIGKCASEYSRMGAVWLKPEKHNWMNTMRPGSGTLKSAAA